MRKRKKEDRRKKWIRLHPWVRLMSLARRRCGTGNGSKRWHKFYRDKGIKCHITAGQIKEIWIRDDAENMKLPSLDRKDSRFDYTNWNCRILEFNENAMIATNLRLAKIAARKQSDTTA